MSTSATQACDTLLRGMVVTMDAGRRVFLDGYVAVRGSRIVGAGRWADCPFTAPEVLGGVGVAVSAAALAAEEEHEAHEREHRDLKSRRSSCSRRA